MNKKEDLIMMNISLKEKAQSKSHMQGYNLKYIYKIDFKCMHHPIFSSQVINDINISFIFMSF